jgi:hypothetical protein
MNAALAAQLIEIGRLALIGLLQLKENDQSNGLYIPSLNAALSEDRPLTAEEYAPVAAASDAAHAALQSA